MTSIAKKFENFSKNNNFGFFKLKKANEILFEGNYFFIVKDSYPVSKGHLLIFSKRNVRDYFRLNKEEQNELTSLIEIAKKIIDLEYSPSGYNIGMNCGKDAGQTVMHFHCHIIPRYNGDMDDPSGGVRYCIPSKGRYK